MRLPAHQDRTLVERDSRPLMRAGFLVVLLLSLTPVLALLHTAFFAHGAFRPADALDQMLRPASLRATWTSLETAGLSAMLAMAIGGSAAFVLAATDLRGKRLFAFLFAASMLIAPQVAGLAFKTLAGPASPLLKMLGLAPPPGTPNPLLGKLGVILILGLHHAPLAMLTLLAGLKSVPNAQIEAARLDGASPFGLSVRIVAPLVRGHVVAAILLCFVAALGNFGIPALLGLPVNVETLPTLMYRRLASVGPGSIADVAALSVLVGAVALAAVAASEWLLRRTPEALEGEVRLRPYWPLGRLRPAVETVMIALIGVALVLPVASLASAALSPAYGVPLSWATASMAAFTEVLVRQPATLAALATSFWLSASAALIVSLLAVPVAYAVTHASRRGRLVAGFMVDVPYALPGIVLAIATILLLLKPLPLLNISLYATPWIILFAYVARFMALAVKPVAASLRQIDPALEEAGALCGAGPVTRLLTLVRPAIAPAMLAGAMFVFLTAFNELTVSALLWSAGARTLGVVMYGLEEAGLTPEASALGLSTIAVVLALMLALDRMGRSLPPGVLPWAVDSD